MPSLLAHYALSLMALWYVGSMRQRLIVAFAGLLPDLDALLAMHRSPLHSIVVWASVGAAGCLLRGWRPVLAKRLLVVSWLAILHIVADLFTGPTPLLWPVSSSMVSLDPTVMVRVDGSSVRVVEASAGASVLPAVFSRGPVTGPLIDPIGCVVMATAAAMMVVERFRRLQSCLRV